MPSNVAGLVRWSFTITEFLLVSVIYCIVFCTFYDIYLYFCKKSKGYIFLSSGRVVEMERSLSELEALA